MKTYTLADAGSETLKNAVVGFLGYGAQGRAQAMNLRDSGAGRILVGLRHGSASVAKAEEDGFEAVTTEVAARTADYLVMAVPDEIHGEIYAQTVAPFMRPQKCLVLLHGFSVHFGHITPRSDLDVVLIAPKAAGAVMRTLFTQGRGVFALLGVHKNASGRALKRAVCYAAALGCAKAALIRSSFEEECVTDLFSEQAVLCGGLSRLIEMAYTQLTKAGYQPEVAYIECLHEVKLIADLFYQYGIDGMMERVSTTAAFGRVHAAARVFPDEKGEALAGLLQDIQDGTFARLFMAEKKAGFGHLRACKCADSESSLAEVGRPMRALLFSKGQEKCT